MNKAPTPDEITRILREWRSGNKEALDRLVPVVYDELRILASRQLAHEWRHNRLDTTAVVNEAYLKLFAQREVDWQNRGHFFAIAAQLMRRIVVDHARRLLRDQHGGGRSMSHCTIPTRPRMLRRSTRWTRSPSTGPCKSSNSRIPTRAG